MVKAIVLISTEVGREDETLEELRRIDAVKRAYFVYGVYDIVAIVEGASLDDIRSIVINRIRRMSSVRSTVTMVVVREVEKE